MELLYYFLKVSTCTMLFFGFYLLVLRKLTFFRINRFYLLFTLIISFIIPTLHFTVERQLSESPIISTAQFRADTEISGIGYQTPIMVGNEPALKETFDYYSVLPYIYFGVVAGLLLFASWRLLQLVKHTRNSVEEVNGLKIVPKAKGFTNCSFFNYVFIDEKSLTETELNILLTHEEVHAKQLHSIDKIILMILKAVLWFNPIVYFYDKALEEAHEYEADEATSQNFGTPEYAGLLLRLAISKSEMPLVHNFVKSPIKARIKMLFNSKSKNMKKLMYLLALPIGLGLLWGFTVDVVGVLPSAKAEDKTFTLVLDAGHGGKNLGATAGGFTEKDIALAMAKKIKAFAEAKGLKVVLTRNVDEYIDLTTRASVNGNVLLSLHINSEPANLGGKRNGIEMFTTVDNNDKVKQVKAKSLSQHLFEGMQNIEGISVRDSLRQANFALLRSSKALGIILELGYLTNKNDFKYITNETNQDELAKGIVNGILAYKEKSSSDKILETKGNKQNLKGYNIPNRVRNNEAMGKDKQLVQIAETRPNEELNTEQNKPVLANGVSFFAKDSTRVDKLNQVIYLYGSAVLSTRENSYQGSSIVYNKKDNNIKVYKASMYNNKNGRVIYVADSMHVNLNTSQGIWSGRTTVTNN